MDVSEARRLKQLEDEDRWLRQAVADLTLDKSSPETGALKKALTPAARREAAGIVVSERGLSERRACRLVGLWRSTYRRRSVRPTNSPLCERLRTLAGE